MSKIKHETFKGLATEAADFAARVAPAPLGGHAVAAILSFLDVDPRASTLRRAEYRAVAAEAFDRHVARELAKP